MKLKIKKLQDNAIIPQFKTIGSAGMDICSIEDVILQPSEFRIIKTGLAMQIEQGYEIQVRPRSGLACKYGITVINTPGTIDSDYTGEVGVGLINLSKTEYHINVGDRIAQLVINKVEQPEIELVQELDQTERGSGGFGSTGK
jgi:dUTP pyrophosphatase